ncbi:MAG: DUF4197 family protein [Desulfuromonadaceae bacterium]|nr:DUF4197 family protein [Desulfuromonas sp.]MDY0185324.1 DUF4197 family protein [Desulfuromonadaceae bacterium]
MKAESAKKFASIVLFALLCWVFPIVTQAYANKVPNRSLTGLTVDADGVAMDEGTVAAGLKEALCLAIDQSLRKCGNEGGFSSNAKLSIVFPLGISSIASGSCNVQVWDNLKLLEKQMNTVAEMASSAAAPTFYAAVQQLDFPFGIEVLRGDNNAATTYVRDRAYAVIKLEISSLVRRKMVEAGLYQDFCNFVQVFKLESKSNHISYNDVHAHITERTMEGLFATLEYYENIMSVAPEELPTATLRRLFAH